MQIYKIDPQNPDPKIINITADAIKNGKAVVYPSDTSYGLAVNSLDTNAIKLLNAIKGPDRNKPTSSNVKDIEMIKRFAIVSEQNEIILNKYLPGAVTFILPAKDMGRLPGNNPSFRIPGTPTTNAISEILDMPYTATSANLAGHPNAYTPAQIMKYFGSSRPQPSIFLDAGPLEQTLPSTVVDLTGQKPKIIRQGPVKIEEIS